MEMWGGVVPNRGVASDGACPANKGQSEEIDN